MPNRNTSVILRGNTWIGGISSRIQQWRMRQLTPRPAVSSIRHMNYRHCYMILKRQRKCCLCAITAITKRPQSSPIVASCTVGNTASDSDSHAETGPVKTRLNLNSTYAAVSELSEGETLILETKVDCVKPSYLPDAWIVQVWRVSISPHFMGLTPVSLAMMAFTCGVLVSKPLPETPI